MIKAKDIMTKNPITVTPDMEIVNAAKILLENRINGVPVVEKGKLVGILCQSDLISQQKKFPMPSVFTILDGFIPLRSNKDIEKTVKKLAATVVRDAMTDDPNSPAVLTSCAKTVLRGSETTGSPTIPPATE